MRGHSLGGIDGRGNIPVSRILLTFLGISTLSSLLP